MFKFYYEGMFLFFRDRLFYAEMLYYLEKNDVKCIKLK